jgi:hypothetical protein
LVVIDRRWPREERGGEEARKARREGRKEHNELVQPIGREKCTSIFHIFFLLRPNFFPFAAAASVLIFPL